MRWFVDNDGLGVCTDLTMSCVLKGAEPEGNKQDDPYAPPASVREACLTLKEFLCSSPKHYTEGANIASLSGESIVLFVLLSIYETMDSTFAFVGSTLGNNLCGH